MAWTDQMVEDLRVMWKQGMTTAEIGKRLGVSKNSIVGKVHRLGLSGRPSPIKKKEKPEAAEVTAAPKEKNNRGEKETAKKTTERENDKPQVSKTAAPAARQPAHRQAVSPDGCKRPGADGLRVCNPAGDLGIGGNSDCAYGRLTAVGNRINCPGPSGIWI